MCLLHLALTLREVSLQVLAWLIEDVCHLDSHSQHVVPRWSEQIAVLCTLVTHQVCNAKADQKHNFQKKVFGLFSL